MNKYLMVDSINFELKCLKNSCSPQVNVNNLIKLDTIGGRPKKGVGAVFQSHHQDISHIFFLFSVSFVNMFPLSESSVSLSPLLRRLASQIRILSDTFIWRTNKIIIAFIECEEQNQ